MNMNTSKIIDAIQKDKFTYETTNEHHLSVAPCDNWSTIMGAILKVNLDTSKSIASESKLALLIYIKY